MRIGAYPVCAALAMLLGCTSIHATPIARLTLQSQPGDLIGHGGSFDITYPENPRDDPIVVGLYTIINGFPGDVTFLLTSSKGSSAISVGTRGLGIPLTPGTYLNAQLDPLAAPGHPALSVSFQGIGCDTITGNFSIKDVAFSDPNTLSSFAFSFEQHCEGVAPALFGTFTYSASGTLVPEPAGYSLLGIGTAWLLLWKSKRLRRAWRSCYTAQICV